MRGDAAQDRQDLRALTLPLLRPLLGLLGFPLAIFPVERGDQLQEQVKGDALDTIAPRIAIDRGEGYRGWAGFDDGRAHRHGKPCREPLAVTIEPPEGRPGKFRLRTQDRILRALY